jgi:photosystem II stability/assembly factor-like uncharacterized protein
MRCLFTLLFIFFILQSSFSTPICFADSNWQSIGPNGGDVNSIIIAPANSQTIFAATWSAGVFKSSNGGGSWNAVNSGLINPNIFTLSIDPQNSQTIFAGTPAGVFKTVDGGNNWTQMNSGLADLFIHSLVISPADSQTIYAGTSTGGIYKTVNGGSRWDLVDGGLTTADVDSLAISTADGQTIYAGTSGGLFKSTDGGATWSSSSNGLTVASVISLVIDPSASQTVYAGTTDGVFKSANGGANWSAASSGLTGSYIYSMAIDPATPRTIYAATGNGLCKSGNGGASWSASGDGLAAAATKSLAIDPGAPQTIYAGTNGVGVFKSSNGGTGWKAVNSGLSAIWIYSLKIDPANNLTVYAGGDAGRVYKTTDAGKSLNTLFIGATTAISSLAIDPAYSQTIYAGTIGGGVYKSVNGGNDWTQSGLMTKEVFSLVIDPANNQTLYAGTESDGVYKSLNAGNSWTLMSSGLTATRIWSLAIAPKNSQVIYAGTGAGGFKSLNGGSNWTQMANGLPATTIACLVTDPNDNQTVYAAPTMAGVFKSINGGVSWTAINSGLPSQQSVQSLAFDPTDSQTVYAGARDLFKSTNGGDSWVALNTGLASTSFYSLAIDPTNPQAIYGGTIGAGIYRSISSSTAPYITSTSNTAFAVGTPGSYTLSATGSPSPVFSMTGSLPIGVTFSSTTGVLNGTPAAGSAGTYNLLFSASNGIPPDATRGVTLTVLPAVPLNLAIVTPAANSKTATLPSISGTASGAGLAKIEVQITDGTYYLQPNSTFTTTPAWLTASGTTNWTLDTSSVPWVDGISYAVLARASDGTTPTQPLKSTVKILASSSKAYSQISLSFTPSNLKSGDTTVATGQIIRLPDDGSSMAGLPVDLIIMPPSTSANPTPAPIVIPVTTGSSGYFASTPLTQFITPGVYLAQVRFDGNSTLAACSTVPQPLYINIQSGYAIIITGKAPDNSLLDQHTASADTIYATLVNKRGFLPGNITYLKSTRSLAVTTQQIQDAITIWARDKIAAAPAPIYIIMIDHGTQNGFVLGDQTLSAENLKGYLESLEADPAVVASGALSSFNRFVIIGSCYSGEFVPKLSKSGRVIITSAAPDEQSLAGVNVFGITSGALYGGDYFIDTFFSFFGRGETVKDSFNGAISALSVRDPRTIPLGLHYGSYDILAQHPLLDDDGDGVPSYNLTGSNDGIKSAALTLGEGIMVNGLGNPADIASVTSTDTLPNSTTSKQLWLAANINSRVGRAWAEIRRPGSQTSGSGSGQFIPTLDMIPLIYDGTDWVGTYTTFTGPGTYDIFYYTQDNQTGDISPSAHSTVYKQLANNTAPSAFSLTSPGDAGSVSPMFPLAWQEATSNNAVTYTLLVATNQSFTNTVYKQESIPHAATYMPNDALKDPASASGGYYCQNGDTYCYWKVQAIDSFGAVSESNSSSFTIVATNGLPGIVYGYLRDSATGAPIAKATIKVGSATATTLSNGAFLMEMTTGNYSISVTAATGYQLKSFPSVIVTAGRVTNAGMTLAANTATSKPGDCNGDNIVSIAEVQSAINMFLGLKPVQACVDQDSNGVVTISEVQKVINSFLGL